MKGKYPMKIVAFYDIKQFSSENRVFASSTKTVIDYMTEVLVKNNIEVEIVSPSETRNRNGHYKKRSTLISPHIQLTVGDTWGAESKIVRNLLKIYSRLWLVFYLIFHTKKDEWIFIWHSPPLFEPIFLFMLLTKLKKRKILYFVGEIYQQVRELSQYRIHEEYTLIHMMDSYIFSTEFLRQYLNITNKTSIILSGTYKPEKKVNSKFQDSKIHIVYAGIINITKGAKTTVDIADYLDSDYCIHIIGRGETENDLLALKQYISDKPDRACSVEYHGLLIDEDYISFLQKCTIGLCPQDTSVAYNNTSFPSKIFSYLANGLRVVTVDIPTIRNSEVSNLLYFSCSNKAIDLAHTIKCINYKDNYNSYEVLEKMNENFSEKLIGLLKGHFK